MGQDIPQSSIALAMLGPCQVCASGSSLQRNYENMSLRHFEELIWHPGFFNLWEHNHFWIVCFVTPLWERDVTCSDVAVAFARGEKISRVWVRQSAPAGPERAAGAQGQHGRGPTWPPLPAKTPHSSLPASPSQVKTNGASSIVYNVSFSRGDLRFLTREVIYYWITLLSRLFSAGLSDLCFPFAAWKARGWRDITTEGLISVSTGIISQLNNLRIIVCFICCPIEKLLVFFSSECEHLLSEGVLCKLPNCGLLSTVPSPKSQQPFLKQKKPNLDASILFAPAHLGRLWILI